MLRHRLALLLLAAACGAGAPEAHGQSQQVSVSHSTVDLVVPYTGAGYGTAVDTSSRLDWQGANPPHRVSKITVSSLVALPTYTLSVRATGVTGGTAAGTVTLTGAAATDLVVNIPGRRETGAATLRYEASVPPGVMTSGQDLHTVIYTITQQ